MSFGSNDKDRPVSLTHKSNCSIFINPAAGGKRKCDCGVERDDAIKKLCQVMSYDIACRMYDFFYRHEYDMRVGEDMICPVTRKHCDDECCQVGALCNLFAPPPPDSWESEPTKVDPERRVMPGVLAFKHDGKIIRFAGNPWGYVSWVKLHIAQSSPVYAINAHDKILHLGQDTHQGIIKELRHTENLGWLVFIEGQTKGFCVPEIKIHEGQKVFNSDNTPVYSVKDMGEVVDTYDLYVQLLCDEIEELSGFERNLGWKSSREQAAKMLREQLAKVKEKIKSQNT